MKFRKKPVVIDAIRYDGSNRDEIINTFSEMSFAALGGAFSIITLEGDMSVSEGDWIIRGVKGEFYPCKPDIFELTYEAVR